MSQAVSPRWGAGRALRLRLGAVLFLAAVFRFAGLSWGLPDQRHYFSYHPDEAPLLLPALSVAQGDWNPHFFNYGTLYIYLVAVPARLLGLDSGPLPLAPLYLLARLLTALLGLATVYLAFRLGREIAGEPLGLMAAGLLAILPLHAQLSHFATVDVAGVFFLSLAALGWLGIVRQGAWRSYLLAGAATGLAAATKYSLGLAVVMLPVAALAHLWPRRRALAPLRREFGRAHLPRLAAALGATGAAFLAGCPFVFTSAGGFRLNPEFLEAFRFELAHLQSGGTFAFVGSGSGWGYHFFHGSPAAFGLPLTGLLLLGIALSVARRRAAWSVLLLWCFVYFLVIGFGKERFVRYLLPLTPFFALAAGRAGLALWQLKRAPWLGRGAFLGALALTLCYSADQTALLLTRDPRDQAADWALARRPARIGLAEAPWFFTPPVTPFNGGARSRALFEEWSRKRGDWPRCVPTSFCLAMSSCAT